MPSPRPVQHSPGPLPGQLRGVLEPIVAGVGFELDELDVRVAGRRHTVKVVVDSDNGVGLDDIARVSRAASEALDKHEHLIAGSYTLEVTSPGAERPLTGQRHWRRANLRKVAVRTKDGKSFTARVGAAGESAVTLLVDGALRELAYADVEKAAVEVEFRPPPEAEVRKLRGSSDQTPEGTS
ncbi:ribosome maturation factor RimP [Pseudonocardia sp. TRM90224]|uniref:ribosome maturation factor RimP n=1 Tax=Pseudonocardia sp. TRM90224 TaxID=2812678 RepID=UPI001E5BDF3F|nr:ribosome maturation factor RimP [Pseudonocardia sp. TRM90224]